MSGIDKHKLLQILRDTLTAQLESAQQQQQQTQDGAFHEENRAEDAKDTRQIEASYLARGLAQRVVELRASLDLFAGLRPRAFADDDPAALGALLSLEDEQDRVVHYFLGPAEGGLAVEVDGVEIKVVTPSSPLGRALLGKQLDDEITFDSPQGRKELTLVELA